MQQSGWRREIYQFEQAGIDGLRRGFGKQVPVEAIGFPELRREVLEKVGLFDESLRVSGDYDLWVRFCQSHDMGVLHQRLVRLRAHSGQLSNAKSSGIPFIEENRVIPQ